MWFLKCLVLQFLQVGSSLISYAEKRNVQNLHPCSPNETFLEVTYRFRSNEDGSFRKYKASTVFKCECKHEHYGPEYEMMIDFYTTIKSSVCLSSIQDTNSRRFEIIDECRTEDQICQVDFLELYGEEKPGEKYVEYTFRPCACSSYKTCLVAKDALSAKLYRCVSAPKRKDEDPRPVSETNDFKKVKDTIIKKFEFKNEPRKPVCSFDAGMTWACDATNIHKDSRTEEVWKSQTSPGRRKRNSYVAQVFGINRFLRPMRLLDSAHKRR